MGQAKDDVEDVRQVWDFRAVPGVRVRTKIHGIGSDWRFITYKEAGIYPIWNTKIDHSPNFEWIIQQILDGVSAYVIARKLKIEKGESMDGHTIINYIKWCIPKKYLIPKSQYKEMCEGNPCLQLLDEYTEMINIYMAMKAKVNFYMSKEADGVATPREIWYVERGLMELSRLLALMSASKAQLKPIPKAFVRDTLPCPRFQLEDGAITWKETAKK